MIYFILGNFEEGPSQKLLCNTDNECPNTLSCVNRTCISPCTTVSCGPNAFCEVDNHAAWCRCSPGYTKPEGGKCISGETINFYYITHAVYFQDP